FAITDAHYGQTSAVYQCSSCGFMQCNDLPDVLSYYEQLEDQAYENSRNERFLQSEALLRKLKKYQKSGKLLDVGAGSGILVEAAIKSGYDATGIEPSTWLQEQAVKQNLPVTKGILSDVPEEKKYDTITVIDVIEHVADPIGLLKEVGARLKEQGVAMIVTPDCRSWFARILGRKWWHFRMAHIGYFNKKTLAMACRKAGLEIVSQNRPGWYFTIDYLWVRFMQYFPSWLRLRPLNWMKRITVPLNLRDSLLIIVKHQQPSSYGTR
ncbi:MAG: class I SAM-dependent methyltransferase, partial [Verrucomicrobia bacterium]|nr:class I SAM-dependent methyltransferase [Verrucomicrobiota bacterium]